MQGSTALKILAAMATIALVSVFAFMAYQPGATSPVNWEAGDEEPILWFHPSEGALFLVGNGNVSLVNETGHLLWSRPFAGAQFPAVGEDGRLYVYSGERGVTAFSRDGNASFIGRYDINRPPVVDRNGTAYLRAWARLTAVRPGGDESWMEAGVLADPALDARGNIYYLTRPASSPSEVYLSSRSPEGTLQWSLPLDRYGSDTALTAADEGIYVYSGRESELYRVSVDGNITWKYYKPYLGPYQLVEDEQGKQYLVYRKGTVHVLSREGYLLGKYALDLAFDADAAPRIAAGNGTLYAAGQDSASESVTVYATGLDGEARWKAQVNSSRPLKMYASGDVVCVAAELERNSKVLPVLYVFNAGGLQYAFRPVDGRPWDQVKIVEGTVYARTSGGKLYSLKGA